MTIEQLRAQLVDAREKYNQIVNATQIQEDKFRENEQRKKFLNQMAEKAKITKANLDAEIQKFKSENHSRIQNIRRSSHCKLMQYQEDFQNIERNGREKELEYKVLQSRYKLLKSQWSQQEQEFLITMNELDQVYIQLKAKINEVTDRVSNIQTKQRPDFNFNQGLNASGDISNIFAPSASEIEELESNYKDGIDDNSPSSIGNFNVDQTNEKAHRDLENSKFILEKLKIECRSLQYQREKLLKLIQEKEGS